MSYSIFRLFRSVRTACAPITLVILFSFLLTWEFILYRPSHGPGLSQKVGWQAWEVVSMSKSQTPIEDEKGVGKIHEGADWWDVNTTKPQDTSSLPLDVWSPLLQHDTALTEIEIAKCLFPAYMSEFCGFPKTTTEADAQKGKWVRVEVDLNMRSGVWSLFLYYRRSRRLDVRTIDQIVLLPKAEEPTGEGHWHKVSLSIRDGVYNVPPLFLWYHYSENTPSKQTDEEKANMITELDVLFGDDRPWYGFEKLTPATTPGKPGKTDPVYVTYRRGVKPPPPAKPLHFSHDGKFKILQVADLHFSVGPGECRDVDFPCEASDNRTLTLLSHVIDEEKPDFVVFTGDQLNGQGTTWDPKTVLAKFAGPVIDRGIPWTAVFGNHDSEDGISRSVQAKLMQGLPYSLIQPGPQDVHGVGNYVLHVKSADPSMTSLLTLYFLDSGSYNAGKIDFWGFFHGTEYDWLRQSQVDWFLQESASIKPIERPFRPSERDMEFGGEGTGREEGDDGDGEDDEDEDKKTKRQSAGQLTPDQKLAKPNAMMFFHMPMQESFLPADKDPDSARSLDFGIHNLEEGGAAKGNDGFFDKALLQAKETAHNAGRLQEVKVVANGHSHVTENCRRVKGVWLCFGGGGSYSGYGKVGFDRRFRVYDVSDYGETIRTYKRTENDEIIDDMVLVGTGAPKPYEGMR